MGSFWAWGAFGTGELLARELFWGAFILGGFWRGAFGWGAFFGGAYVHTPVWLG